MRGGGRGHLGLHGLVLSQQPHVLKLQLSGGRRRG